jgi:predicted HTH domain antitoxin
MELTIKIPEHISKSLKLPPKDREKYLLSQLSLLLYKEGVLSFGKARQLGGFSKWEFHEELGKRAMDRHYDLDNLNEDLKYAGYSGI